MRKGMVGAAKIGASVAFLVAALAFSVYIIFPALAVLDGTVNTLVINAPANNTYARGTILLNASLAGTNSSSNVTFYYENSTRKYLIGINTTAPNNGEFNITRYFDTTILADGSYSIFANATNLTGEVVVNATNGNITVDNTNPVLNFPTPANNSYIYGTSAQLFQTNVTETNFQINKNITLNYKVNTTSTWTQTTLICYDAAFTKALASTPYICNTTVDMTSLYIENDRIQYFFNTTDFAGNTGNNGTASDPLFIILDQTKPTPTISTTNDTDNIIAKGYGINLSVRWTDNYGLFNATLWTNETCYGVQQPTCAGQNKTTAYGSPYTLSGTNDWSNFTWANNSITVGTVVAWKVYANDQVQPVRNENVSIQGTFTIDGTAPTPSSNATSVANGSVYSTSANYGFQINWNDVVGVSNATFELGRPDGTLTNYTNASTPGVQYLGSTFWINFTQAAFGPGGTYNFTWLANDTSNNWNRNDTIGYTIVQAAAPTVQLQLNGTEGNRTYNKSDVVNQSAVSSISGLTVVLYNNMSGTLAQIGSRASSLNVTNSTSSLSLGTYLVLANVSSNENYTANVTGVSYFITLTDGIIPTLIIRNATSEQYLNNTYVKDNTVLTLNISVSDNDVFANSFNASVYINTTFAGNITNTSSDTANGTVTVPAGLANGNSFLNVSVSDASGNIAYNTSIMLIVDNINPVLSNPVPTNNSNITGTSTQLFQVNASETNFDSTKNITLNYKRAGIPSWTQATLACYDAAGTKAMASGPFKCNTTVDLSGFGNVVIQYYFNTTDLAGNTGTLGTAASWLNTTIDRGIPQYLANVSSPDTYANYSASGSYGFQINWTNGLSGIQIVTFQLGRPVGTLTNSTASLASGYANTYIVNFSQAAFGPAGTYNITWFANDTAGNANTTGTYGYQIYNATNIVNVYLNDSTGQYANMNINTTYGNATSIRATASAGTVYIYRNATLNLTNGTSPQIEGGVLEAGFVVYKVNATGNENYTDNTSTIQYNITIDKAGITNYLNLQINGTGADSIRAYPNVTNVTGWANVTGQSSLGFVLFRNGANMTINNTAADYNRTEINLLGVGNYTYIYNTTGNANYTSGSITRVLNITKGTPALGLFINSSFANQTYLYPTVTQVTANNTDVLNTDGVYELFRNNTNLTGSGNNTNVTLAAGVYLFVHNVTAGTNYTSGTASLYLTISKAATSVQVWLNGTAATSATYTRTQVLNFTAALNVSGKTIYLESNYSAGWINQSATPLENLTTLNTKGIYNFTAYFNADENYTASTNYTTITVNDIGVPTYTGNATSLANGSAYSTSANYGFQINWTDDVAVFNATFQLGRPNGQITNYTNSSGSIPAVRLTESIYHINFTQDQLGPAGNYNITWFANDTSNNWNATDAVGYVIIPAATNTTLWVNNNAANASIEQGNNVNLTATLNITNTVYIYANLTGWVLLSNSAGTLTNTTSSSGVTPRNFSNITAYFIGNENYSASSQHFHINITSDTTGPTILLLNATSQPFLNASVTKKSGLTFAVNASVSDTGVGIAGQTCTAYVNGSSAGTGTVSGGFCNMTVTMPSGGSGNVSLNITLADLNGNVGFNSSFVVQMDNSAPVLTVNNPQSGQYIKGTIWVNGTVYDNIAMGTANITVNNTAFSISPYGKFDGTNNSVFNISNVSVPADGYYLLNIGYTDIAGNDGNATIAFYADNTPPSAAVGLTNSTAGTKYAPTTSQTIQVSVTDNLQTNVTITLYYKLPLRDYWNTTAMSGVPGSNTTYSGTIDTSELVTHQNVSYYITGVDNATNLITSGVGGSPSSPLGRITIEINTSGSIDGYIIRNGTTVAVSGATVSDGVRAAVTDTNGHYLISNVPAGTYTVTSAATDYITNSTTGVSVSNGATTRVNITMAYNASGIIQGYVKSNDTMPALLSGAIVSDGTRTVASGANGFYQITGVTPGTYSLNVSKTDYISNSTIGIVVTAGGTANVNLSMAPNDSTAPTITFSAPTNSTNVTTTTPTITFSVEEDVADNIRDISVSGVSGFSKTGNYTGGNAWKGTYSFKPTALTNGQNYTISVTATNKAGLSSTAAIIVRVDTTKGVTASLISSDTSGVADNTYANGWSYTFNITLGTGVNATRVKLDNFTMTTDSTKTIGVPGNVVMNYTNASGYAKSYSVLESYNETYGNIDPLFDLDSSAAGVQGNVTIYVKIPSGTVAGAYSTAYTFGSYTV